MTPATGGGSRAATHRAQPASHPSADSIADSTLTPNSAGIGLRLSAAVARLPWWAQVLFIYGAARVFSALIFMGAALKQGVSPWFPAAPDYWNFIYIWDARWYGEILTNGYPSALPVSDAGVVQENAWAFYPVFPLLGRGLVLLTGMPTAAALTVVAMLAGIAASLVVYLLFRHLASHRDALWGTTFVAMFPVSAILQVPYAESLNLLLLSGALLLVLRHNYTWAIPVVLVMCLSRPVGVPFAAALGFLFLIRLYQAWRIPHRSPLNTRQLVELGVLVVAGCVGAVLWPAMAWLATGDITAYTKTETVWRGEELVPFKPWFDTGIDLFGPVLGLVAPFVFAGLFTWLMFVPPVVRLGSEIRLWCACYMGYLLIFLHPQTSTFRLLLPLFPLALGAVWLSRSRAYRGTVLLMFGLLQLVWIVWLWAWAQLPGGGDYPP